MSSLTGCDGGCRAGWLAGRHSTRGKFMFHGENCSLIKHKARQKKKKDENNTIKIMILTAEQPQHTQQKMIWNEGYRHA